MRLARTLVFLSAVAGLAMGAMPAGGHAPRSHELGQSQPRLTETGLAEHWAVPSITLVLDPSLEDLSPGATDAVRKGVGAWIASVPGLPAMSFEVASERAVARRDGKSTVVAAPITLPGHEKDLALTTAYADDATGAILEADIVFNTDYSYSVIDDVADFHGQAYDVGAVATHEAGHFFGLGEDYDDTTTTMYIFTKPRDTHKRTLTSVDIDAMKPLYASSASSSGTLVASCAASPNPSPARTVPYGLGLVMLSLALRRRRPGGNWVGLG